MTGDIMGNIMGDIMGDIALYIVYSIDTVIFLLF